MKYIVKLISINDGEEKEMHDGNRLWVATYPRMEAITAAFLDHDYELVSCMQRVNPSLQREGDFTFFLGGHDLLFRKQVADDAEDDSDEILQEALEEFELE